MRVRVGKVGPRATGGSVLVYGGWEGAERQHWSRTLPFSPALWPLWLWLCAHLLWLQ